MKFSVFFISLYHQKKKIIFNNIKKNNMNLDTNLLEKRQKYAHQVAKKFEEMISDDER